MSRVPTANDLRRELDRIYESKGVVQRKLVLEERRLDVLARILGFEVLPVHWILLEAKRVLPGSWRLYLAPRGCGKSTMLTVVPAVLDPLIDRQFRSLIGSRTMAHSKALLGAIQGCFELPRFCELFGDLRGEKWGAEEATILGWRKKIEATWIASGIDGPVTGKHFEKVYADDLVDEKNSRTEGERQKVHTFFYKILVPTLTMRRSDGTLGEIDLIGTRYSPDDIFDHAINKDPKFRGNVCEIPALVDPETGEADAENGVSIVEEMLPTEDLKAYRISMGPAHFDSQYQQSTTRLKGDIFSDAMFHADYEEEPEALVRSLELKVWGACDLAIAEREQQDEYSDTVIGVDDRDPDALHVYVLDHYAGLIPYAPQISRAAYLFERWGEWMVRFGIEANAFQKARLHAVYAELGAEVGDRCVPIITLTDKVTRAWKLAARYEAGRIHHQKDAAWREKLEAQLISFPEGKRDDRFDSLDLAVTLGCVVRGRRKRKRKVGLFGGGRAVRRQSMVVTTGGIT